MQGCDVRVCVHAYVLSSPEAALTSLADFKAPSEAGSCLEQREVATGLAQRVIWVSWHGFALAGSVVAWPVPAQEKEPPPAD